MRDGGKSAEHDNGVLYPSTYPAYMRPPLNQNSYLACTFSWKFQSLKFSKPAGMMIIIEL